MGRAERRRAQKRQNEANRARRQADAVRAMKTNDRIVRYAQNGITPEDMEKAVEKAKADAHIESYCCSIAAFCNALHDLYGFGAKRCVKVSTKAYEKLMLSCDADELIDEMIVKIGMTIDWNDPLQPITMRSVKK